MKRSLPDRSRTPRTQRDWRRHVERELRIARLVYGHGTRNAREEATWILAHSLRLPFSALGVAADDIVSDRDARRIEAATRERIASRRPLAYVLGEAWLAGHRFAVDRRVIVPRSFIAHLLTDALAPWVSAPDRVRRVLDLCTGSGCLAILAAKAFPRARIDAAEISRAALQVATRNVRAYGLAPRVRLVRSDLFSALGPERYDLILSNPPYVSGRGMRALPPEYRAEPRLALDGGADGLDLVRRLLAAAARHLTPRGLLVVEIGHNRARLERAFPRLPFTWLAGPGDAVFLLERSQLDRAKAA